MTFIMSKPGRLSDWIRLADALLTYATDKEDESIKEAQKHLDEFEVRIKVLMRLEALKLWEMYDKSETPIDRHNADKAAIKSGLADYRGTDCDGHQIDEEFIDMLMASGVGYQIAMIIRSYQAISQEQRAGFFTQAPAA